MRGGEKQLETNGNKRDVPTAITRSSRVSGLKGYVKGILGLTGQIGIQSVSDVQGGQNTLANRGSLVSGKFTLKHPPGESGW